MMVTLFSRDRCLVRAKPTLPTPTMMIFIERSLAASHSAALDGAFSSYKEI